MAKHWDWQQITQLTRASDYSMLILYIYISGSGSPTCSYNNTYLPPRNWEENMLVNWRRSRPWISSWLLQTYLVVICQNIIIGRDLKLHELYFQSMSMYVGENKLKIFGWSLKGKKHIVDQLLLRRDFFLKIDLKQRIQGVYFHPCFPCYLWSCIFRTEFNLVNVVLSTKVQTLLLAIVL